VAAKDRFDSIGKVTSRKLYFMVTITDFVFYKMSYLLYTFQEVVQIVSHNKYLILIIDDFIKICSVVLPVLEHAFNRTVVVIRAERFKADIGQCHILTLKFGSELFHLGL
jgi:hypothetical protein